MELARSILGKRSPRNLLPDEAVFAVMKAYLDASTNPRMMTLACMVATDDEWAQLEAAWHAILAERGRGVTFMHMTYAMNLKEPFDWEPEQRTHLVDGLLEVLLHTRPNENIRAFSCTVDLQAHRHWSNKRALPSASRICTRNVIEILLRWVMVDWKKEPKKIIEVKPLELVFDRNESFMRHIEPDWRNAKVRKATPELDLISSIGSATMELTPGLQMADMIAWGRNRVESAHIQSDTARHLDPHYATAVRAANTVNGRIVGIPRKSLALDPYPEQGFLKMYAQKEADSLFNMKNTSEEYKKFDRMMRNLLAVRHADVKAKLDAEKVAKKRKKARQSSASGRVASDR